VSAKKTLAERWAELQADYDAAKERRAEAFDRQVRKRSEGPGEVLAPLIDFDRAIEFNRPDAVPLADRDERRRELTRELFEAIEARGLALVTARTSEGPGLTVTDPNVDADYHAALAARNAAQTAIQEFDRDHGDALRAEQRKVEADAIRAALKGDDPDAIREALNGPPDDALTSSDFAPPPDRVTTAG
jgi:hypothetical protein